MLTMTVDDLHAAFRAQGVPTKEDLAWKCPICGTVQSAKELLGWGRRQKETQSQNPRAISKALGRTPPVVHRGLGGHAIIGIFSEFRCALRVARGNT